MRVICPHCQTVYQLQTADTDAVLVCHRCGTEFSLAENTDLAHDTDARPASDAQTPDMFADHSPAGDEGSEIRPETPSQSSEEGPAWATQPNDAADPDSDEAGLSESASWQDAFTVDEPEEHIETGEEHFDEVEPDSEPADAEADKGTETGNESWPDASIEGTDEWSDVQADEEIDAWSDEPAVEESEPQWDQDDATQEDDPVDEPSEELADNLETDLEESDTIEDEYKGEHEVEGDETGSVLDAESEQDMEVPVEAMAEESAEQPDELPSGPPPRAKARIMPWLVSVLLLIAGTGFWMNHEAWLDDPWLRSVLINTGLKLEIRDKDWHIDPQSVSATWLERQGGKTVLVITGDVHNRLQTDLLPPLIHFTLYARDNPDETILERDLIITRPPLMQTIRQAPYTPPARDDAPIAALGKRGFVLVLEDLPQNAGNFSLMAKAR